MNENYYLVSEQSQGIKKNLEHTICLATVEDAEDWFVVAKNKMLDVNNWHRISIAPAATFVLTDSHGKPLHRRAHKGDHIRVEIPGNGMGYEWGTVNAIVYDDYPDEDMESMALHVQPATARHNGSPNHHNDNGSANTIVIERRGRELSALYQGKIGTEFTSHADNASENASSTRYSEIQWKGIVEGLLTM